MRKYASSTTSLEQVEFRELTRLEKAAHRHTFQYEPREGYLYVRSRAISSRTNDNFDTFPASELRLAWASFIGKPVFVNHHNEDIHRKRGVIIDAVIHEDASPDGTEDTWVEVLMEVDAMKFPKLAKAVVAREVERTSMGCDVIESECSYCGNVARTPTQYCAHVQRMKGQRLRRKNDKTGQVEDVLVHEICRGLSFFENSLLVEEPADPTAYAYGVDTRGIEMSPMTASLVEQIEKEADAVAKTRKTKFAYNGMNPPPELDEDGNEIEYEGPDDDSWINPESGPPREQSTREMMIEDLKMGSKTARYERVLEVDEDAPGGGGAWIGYEVYATPGDPKGEFLCAVTSYNEKNLGAEIIDIWGDTPEQALAAGRDEFQRFYTMMGGGSKTASDGRVPRSVDTLRPKDCPVCGEDSGWNTDGRCSTCGYLPAPKPFQEPDTDVAGRVDGSGGWFDPNLTEAPPFELSEEHQVAIDPVQSNLRDIKGQEKVDQSPQGDNTMASKQNSNSVAMTARRRMASNRTPAEAALAQENQELRRRLAAAMPRRVADKENPAQPVPEPSPGAPAASEEDAINAPEAQGVDVTQPGAPLPDQIQNGPADVEAIGGIVPDEILSGTNQTDNVEVPVAGTTEVDPAAVIGVQPDHRAEDFGEPAFAGDHLNPGADTVPDISGNAAGAPEKEARRRPTQAQRVALGKQVAAARDRIWASIQLAEARIAARQESGSLLDIARRIEASGDSIDLMTRESAMIRRIVASAPTPVPQGTGRSASRRAPSLRSERPAVQASTAMGLHGSDDEALFE